MSTRRKTDPGAPLSEDAYMSSPEFVELRGINAVSVKEKTALLVSQRKKSLLWFLQARSLEESGVKGLAESVAASCYPDLYQSSDRVQRCLIDLCINPRTQFSIPGEDEILGEMERENARSRFRELSDGDFCSYPSLGDIGAKLIEYQQKFEERVVQGFTPTAISKKIWRTLDFALKSRKMVLLDGLEGRGKSESIKAWCKAHLGEARYIDLKGIASKTAVFRDFAKALGVASSYTRKASEMQFRVEDVLERSKMMVVIDEAHWLFNQSARIYTRPELVDWIVTALCNRSVPVALCTTPQFLECMKRAIAQVSWNHRQFQRRCARRVLLPRNNSHKDIMAVMESVFPKAEKRALRRVLSYVLLTRRDLSAFGDFVQEVKYLLSPADPGKADLVGYRLTRSTACQIIDRDLAPGDVAFAFDLGKDIADAQRKRLERYPKEEGTTPPHSTISQPDEAEVDTEVLSAV